MIPLPRGATDADLLAHIDRWVALLEAADYHGAFALVDHEPHMAWTPERIRQVVEGYGKASPTQRVTVAGRPTDVRQHKEVVRWSKPRATGNGRIWYDLNIDGDASDLTATFWIVETPRGIVIRLDDIHVM